MGGRNATHERVKYILKMGFTRPPFIKGKSGGWYPTFLILLSLVPVPNNFSPAMKRTDTEFRNGFGFNSRGQNQVTGIFFTVEQDGTLALCDLSFSTNLVEIDSASVSCQILYDNVGDSVVLGLTDFDWTFFAKLDEEVYEVAASISFNPTTEAIPRLKLCFSSSCTANISSVVEPAATESICDCESSLGAATALGISSSSFYSSQPEGLPLPSHQVVPHHHHHHHLDLDLQQLQQLHQPQQPHIQQQQLLEQQILKAQLLVMLIVKKHIKSLLKQNSLEAHMH